MVRTRPMREGPPRRCLHRAPSLAGRRHAHALPRRPRLPGAARRHERLLYPDEWAERERARKSEEGAASSVSSLVAGVRSMFGLQATKAK